MSQAYLFDAVIVGAGPAGCMAAINAPPPMKLLLIDARDLPRDVICGGILSSWSMSLLKAAVPLPPEIFCSPREIGWIIHDWDLHRIGGIRGTSYINTERDRFDRLLLEHASERENLEVWPQTRFTGTRSGLGGRLHLELSRRGQKVRVETRFLIGADGASSAVRGCLADSGAPDYWITIQQRIRSTGEPVDRFLAVIGKEIDFYGWVIPKGDDLVIGAGYSRRKPDLKSRFKQFRRQLSRRYGIDGPALGKARGRPATRLKSLRQINSGTGNIMLAGEAAGVICPWSGEGIAYALSTGLAVGRALSAASPAAAYKKAVLGHLPRLACDLAGRRIMKSSAGRLVAAKAFPRAFLDPAAGMFPQIGDAG